MSNFINSPGVVEQGLWVIRSVAMQSADLHNKIRSKGIAECIRAAGSAHPENERVTSCAEVCLTILNSEHGSPSGSPKKSSPLKKILKQVGKVLKSPTQA